MINAAVPSCWGVVTTYANERFHTGAPASGFGLGYTFAVILPSFYVFYQNGVSALMPKTYTAVMLLVIGGVLMALGAGARSQANRICGRSIERSRCVE